MTAAWGFDESASDDDVGRAHTAASGASVVERAGHHANESRVDFTADFGISRNGLAKICDRLMIPYAGRGYWAKAQGHGAPARPPLPPAPANSEETVTIASGPAVEPGALTPSVWTTARSENFISPIHTPCFL